MSVKEFAKQLREVVQNIESHGTMAIKTSNLIAYLRDVENSKESEPSPVELEKYKADLQNWVELGKQQHEARMELFRSVITAGQSAIKSSFLLNGGGAVAMLAFVGHLAELDSNKVPLFASSLLPFAIGVLLVTVTSGMTYLSQWLYASNVPAITKAGYALNIVCIVLGFLSYLTFSWGIFVAYALFLNY